MLRQIGASGSYKVGKWSPRRWGGGDNILRFELLSVSEVMAYYAFFLKKRKKYQVTSVREEGRQAKHSTNYSGWRQRATSCKGTNQNNRPLLKRPRGLPPHPSPYKPSPPPSGSCLKAFPPARPAFAHAI